MKPGLVLTSITAVAVLCTLPALSPLLTGSVWWVTPAAIVAAVALTGAGYRATPMTPALLPLAQAAVAACAITAMFTPADALAGFVPTPDSLESLLALIDEGRARIEHQPAPLAPRADVSLILAIAFGLIAIAADFFTMTARAPALTALPLAGPLLVPLATAEHGIGALEMGAATAGYLGLLTADTWTRATAWGTLPGPALGVAAVLGITRHALLATGVSAAALALALLVPLATPGLSNRAVYDLAERVQLGGQTITTTHPMVSLRRELVSPTDREVLQYRSSQSQPDYLRTYVLDVFDGENWTMSPLSTSSDNRITSGAQLPEAPGRQATEQVTTEITLAERARSRDFLPVPYAPREIEVAGDWFAAPESLMIFTTSGATGDGDYVVTSARPDPDPDDLAGSQSGTTGVGERFLDVPGDTDPRVAETTRSVTEDAATPHERAVALQEWFTSDSRFEYSLRPPPVPDDADPLSHFLLESRVGFCEQFAATMTLMARQAGIPARVAVGYTSGEQLSGDTWTVTESDAHAWPELYFEGQGWLRFEPTPSSAGGQGNATVPDYAAPGQQETSTPEEDDETREEPAEPTPEDEPEPDPSEESALPAEDGAGADDAADGGNPWLPVLGALALVALVLAAPALIRAAVRRARLATATAPAATAPDRARAAFNELRDDLVDLGLPHDPAESPRAMARRLATEYRLDAAVREALWRVAMAEESACYAPDPDVSPSLGPDLATSRAGLRTAASRARRIRALVAPRSVLRLPAVRRS